MTHILIHALWAPVLVLAILTLCVCVAEGAESPGVALFLGMVASWVGGFALLMFLSACSGSPTAPARDAGNRLTDCTMTGGGTTRTPDGSMSSVFLQWRCPDGSHWASQWGDVLPPIYRVSP